MRIPRGRVASYGLIGLVAGRPLAARSVGTALSACHDPAVPCHRVVHTDGSLAPTFKSQRLRLEREGVRFEGARVDMRNALWSVRLPPISRHARPRRRINAAGSRAAGRARRAAHRR